MFDKIELNQLYRYCFVLTNNEANAYDLLQSALEKCLRSPPKNESARISYMHTIIRNLFIDQYRSSQHFEYEEFDENNITNIHDELSSLETIMIKQEEAAIIWRTLNTSEREIMYLWAILGFSTSEVSKYLDMPKGTIVSKVSRLRKKVIGKINSDVKMSTA